MIIICLFIWLYFLFCCFLLFNIDHVSPRFSSPPVCNQLLHSNKAGHRVSLLLLAVANTGGKGLLMLLDDMTVRWYIFFIYLGAAVQTTLKVAPKFLVKARCSNILCHYFMSQIPVIIKHTSMLLICFCYCSLPSGSSNESSLISGSSNEIWGKIWGLPVRQQRKWSLLNAQTLLTSVGLCVLSGSIILLNIKYITGMHVSVP